MPDDLFHSNCPNLQLKLQKYLILVLVYAQESVYFESECVMSLFANSIIVNMEKNWTISRNVFPDDEQSFLTYVMMFRAVVLK